jgi:hypothetical protein
MARCKPSTRRQWSIKDHATTINCGERRKKPVMSDVIPQFPNYEPPNPKAPPIAERKQSDPLWKVMRVHLKPHKGLEKRPFMKHKKKVKVM